MTLAAWRCALALAADMDRKAAAIDRADRRTDRLTPDRYMDPAALLVGSVNSRAVSVSVESRVESGHL